VRVKTIDTAASSSVKKFIKAGAQVFFVLSEYRNIDTLWRSDGTEAGTIPLKQFTTYVSDLAVVGSRVFFLLNTFDVPELWVSDGNAEGTRTVMTLPPNIWQSFDQSLASINDILVFAVPGATGHYDLYRSDGTAVGTQLVQTFRPFVPQPNGQQEPHGFTLAGDHLFFSADGGMGQELWAIPTSEGVMASVRAPAALHAAPDGMLTIPVRYDNTGFAATHGLTLTATLDPALKYLSSTSSLTPTVQGDTLTWQAPDLDFLEHGGMQVRVQTPDAELGTSYPISVTLDAPGDTTPDDNTQVIEVVIAQQIFLPLLDR
jgi:ELWxxDGT repeat protein